MDRQTAKRLLAAYRKHDPAFDEALRELDRDPELAAWFEENQRFDAVVAEKLRQVAVPAGLKQRILAGSYVSRNWRKRPALLLLMAAAIVIIGFLAWFATPVPPSHSLAIQAISYTDEMPALQFVCFNASEVAKWVNQQPGARRVGLRLNDPGEAFSMKMIGSSIVDWNGSPVVMLCLQNGRQMAMCYILNDAGAALPDGLSETIRSRGWTARTTKTGSQVRVLATKADAHDFPLPF